MSLNVVQRSDDNYKRDSFEDRVCDDLSQVLLQFLPIEDKLKFECVSKQFQRNVFQKQETLCLTRIENISEVKRYQGNNVVFWWGPEFCHQIETLLKKLPNLKSLVFKSSTFPLKLKDPEVDIIIKYCHKLTKIRCNLFYISYEKRDLFAAKFGEKMFSINPKEIFSSFEFNWIQKSLPKIKESISTKVPSLPMYTFLLVWK